MSEAGKRRRKAVAMGVVGLSALMGVAATGLVVGLSLSPGRIAQEPAASPSAPDWGAIATSAMAGAGYGFATAGLDQGVLRITGDAPGNDARMRAFTVGKDAVLTSPAHVGAVVAFENAITVAGVAQPTVPDAASALGVNPGVDSCQTAYSTLLNGRVINFGSGSAVLATESRPLLDALVAVAARCGSYRVEIGGHTDAVGDTNANQALSERRAQAVADYLVVSGVPAGQLVVVGYGESEPVDAGTGAEADARNRRIEFKVTGQP